MIYLINIADATRRHTIINPIKDRMSRLNDKYSIAKINIIMPVTQAHKRNSSLGDLNFRWYSSIMLPRYIADTIIKGKAMYISNQGIFSDAIVKNIRDPIAQKPLDNAKAFRVFIAQVMLITPNTSGRNS
jgi:Ni/Fe-hydrogenase subunit HybB-like protein